MTNPFSKLTSLALTLMLGIAASGCDQDGTDEPTDRTAQVVVELDGKHVRTWDVAEPAEMQADLILWGALTPGSDVCEDGEVELGLVLEQDGEALASFEGCAAPGGGHASPSEALTADSPAQGTFWCNNCAQTGDCYACCRCDGWTATACSHSCLP